jgi:ribosomal protein L37E
MLKLISTDNNNYTKCPKCGSLNFTIKKNGISISQAIGASLVFGPLGLLHGLTGKDKIIFVCNVCGKQWDPPPPEPGNWPEY